MQQNVKELNQTKKASEAIKTRNEQNIIVVLRESDFFNTPPIPAILQSIIKGNQNRFPIEYIELIVTPFGFFEYKRTVHLSGGVGEAQLRFQPMDLFYHYRVAKTYCEIMRGPRLANAGTFSPVQSHSLAGAPADKRPAQDVDLRD